MQPATSRYLAWGGIVTVLAVVIGVMLTPKAVLVDIDHVTKRDLFITIEEEGKTRIHDTYTVSSPVTGFLRRINADVGDTVELSDTIIASIQPIDAAFLDPRTEAQAKADVDAATSSLKLAQAQVDQVEAELAFAQAEQLRMRELILNNSVSQREFDAAERAYKTTRAALATAQAALQMRTFELARAQAQLVSPADTKVNRTDCECVNITAPISGKILRVLTKDEGVVDVGTPLVEIGDPKQLEVVVELLSYDAVKVEIGQKVNITQWGGDDNLQGVVSRIEPIGFKKISALGIEEQRVNVIVAFTSDYASRIRLGHGYQVDVAIVLSAMPQTVSLPISAVFRLGDEWAIYAVINGRAQQRNVTLGLRSDYYVQVLDGIDENEQFVVHPNDQITTDVLVKDLTL